MKRGGLRADEKEEQYEKHIVRKTRNNKKKKTKMKKEAAGAGEKKRPRRRRWFPVSFLPFSFSFSPSACLLFLSSSFFILFLLVLNSASQRSPLIPELR